MPLIPKLVNIGFSTSLSRHQSIFYLVILIQIGPPSLVIRQMIMQEITISPFVGHAVVRQVWLVSHSLVATTVPPSPRHLPHDLRHLNEAATHPQHSEHSTLPNYLLSPTVVTISRDSWRVKRGYLGIPLHNIKMCLLRADDSFTKPIRPNIIVWEI